ncbi:MAG: lipid IV(A) 3-deoxy-D-manno-octulosonic acid transferase [Steroidobacteraceae bacterium]|jgi:3-deoxy-D-manno-octulosonic-acid transferase
MRRLYSLLMMLAAPVAFAVVLMRGLKDRAYWTTPMERFGFGRWIATPSIWLHAVSLGEVSAAAPLLRALRVRYPEIPFILSTATPTGRNRARTLFGTDVDIRYLAYDTPGSMRRFLARINPRVGVIIETELWPNLLHECRRRGVPVVIASARLTPKSVLRYRRARALFGDAVQNVTIAAQSAEDAQRFIAIGADRARTREVGNLKFDMQLGEDVLEAGRKLRAEYLGKRPVWIAGSTHAGEEEQLLAAHAELKKAVASPLLVLVPRHPQRFESVATLLTRRGERFDRRSAAAPVRADADVLLVDTVGELAALYAAADVAFVGGSLVPVGGHNLLEPAALGVPGITGPYTANSREIARELMLRGGAVQVADAQTLANVLGQFFADPNMRQRAGASAREFVEAHRGTVARLIDLIDPLIASSGPPVKA